MKKSARQAVDPAVVAKESQFLSALWHGTPASVRSSQTVFGERFGIGGQSAVGQFIRGEAPLSLKAAKGFALGLGCKVADFSPRLAVLETAWPFELVDRELYDSLSQALQHRAQLRMNDEIGLIIEEQARKANGTNN